MSVADELRKAQEALRDPNVTFYTYEGRRYSIKEVQDVLIPQLEAARDRERAAAEQRAGEALATGERRRELERLVKQGPATLRRARTDLLKGRITEDQEATIRAQVAENQRLLNEITGRAAPTPTTTPTATTAPTPTTRTTPTVTPPRGDGSAETAETRRLAGQQPAGRTGAPTTTGTGGSGTTTGGAVVPETDKRRKKPSVAGILDELAEMFPAYQDWGVEQATAYFGTDLIKVLTDAASGVYGVGEQKSREAIQRAIRGTNYWQTTEAAIRRWDGLEPTAQNRAVLDQKKQLAQTFGELQLDDATLTDLATTIQRTGLNELGAKQLVYGAAFARPRTETGLQPRQLALESGAADRLRAVAKAYGFAPRDLDAQIESILTGQAYAPTGTVLTEDSFRQKAERYARGQYAHLKDQFDSGLTLEDVFGNYRELASRVLELDPTAIDFAAEPEKWSDAFGTPESGQLSLSQWVAKLKSDEKYGWQFTQNAKRQADNLVMELEKAFGYRR
jgi:hypothetical protein